MHVEHARQCLLLQGHPGLTSARFTDLLRSYGSVASLWQSNPDDWPDPAIGSVARIAFQRLRDRGDHAAATHRRPVEQELASLQALDAQVLDLTEQAYPALLRQIFDPPPLLYVRGDISDLQRPLLAMVGSRRASAAGLRAAQDFSAEAVAAGLLVGSGLALGIDAAAHRGALAAGGRSIAVMATGVDAIYPRRHRDLAMQLLEHGALITEFAPGTPPLREHFPRRNRIISGLALGVLVIEAALPSGSLITAGTALEQGREVFTLPWSIYHPAGRGCLHLLRDGAVMALSMDDILAQLGPMYAVQQELPLAGSAATDTDPTLSLVESRLLDLIGADPVAVDELIQRGDLPVSETLAALSSLELAGRVDRSLEGYRRVLPQV